MLKEAEPVAEAVGEAEPVAEAVGEEVPVAAEAVEVPTEPEDPTAHADGDYGKLSPMGADRRVPLPAGSDLARACFPRAPRNRGDPSEHFDAFDSRQRSPAA